MHNKYQRLVLEGSNDGVNWTVQEPIQYKAGDLIEENSADCGGSGEGVKYRWVTVAGEFMCINNDKYTVIKKQIYNVEHGVWDDVEPLETTYGELVEANSGYCGYGEYWVDTENWECASISNAHTTKVTCYDGGSCMWSYSGSSGVIGGQYWIDTIGGTVYLSAIPVDAYRKPMKVMYIDGVSTTSTNVSIAGNADHNVSMYFYSKSLWKVDAGENISFIYDPKPPLRVQDGDILTLSASSQAPALGGGAWGFDHWSVGYDYSAYEPQQFSIYYSNPLKLVVTSDCRVDLYYQNESVKTGYTLIYNGATELEVSNQQYLRPSVWYFDETWFINNRLSTLSTKANVSPNTLLYIGLQCFAADNYSSWAKYLQSVDFPTVKTVYSSAFQWLSYLTHVGLDNCEEIYPDAFKSCTRLQSISLPNCTMLGARCFMNCTNLSKVYLLGGQFCSLNGRNQFYNCPNLQSIIVPGILYNKYKTAWSSYAGLISPY